MFVGLKRWRAYYIYCTAMESVAFWSLWLSPLVNIPQSTSQALFSTHISQLQRYIPPLIHFFADTLWKLDYWNLDWYLYVYYGCSLIHVPHLLWEMNVGLQGQGQGQGQGFLVTLGHFGEKKEIRISSQTPVFS